MKNLLSLSFFVAILMSANTLWAQGKAKAFVVLNPAGDFVAEMNTIKGGAQVSGDKVVARDVVIDLTTLKTGLELRDDHAKNKYLDVKNHPTAVVVEAIGQGGKGQAKIKMKGKEALVNGVYKVNGKMVDLEFKVKLSQFGIEDINYKGIGVEDEVKIQASIPIVAAAAPAAGAKPAAAAPAKPKGK